jgi:hypothetical protein
MILGLALIIGLFLNNYQGYFFAVHRLRTRHILLPYL